LLVDIPRHASVGISFDFAILAGESARRCASHFAYFTQAAGLSDDGIEHLYDEALLRVRQLLGFAVATLAQGPAW
jgi:hypothetical protein